MKFTVGDVRKAIEGLPDDAEVCPCWNIEPNEDDKPDIQIDGLEVFDMGDIGIRYLPRKYLAILIRQFEVVRKH